MPEPISTTALAVDWIPRLARTLTGIRGARREEIVKLSDEFGDAELLAERYIDPDCQLFNPADLDEDEPAIAHSSPIRQFLAKFLGGRFRKKDGRHVVFVLSDAGMGKTSLLTMLKLTHLLRFWPKAVHFELLKLGHDTLKQVGALQNRGQTVLLLDALDEDPAGWGRIVERLRELLQATETFRQVVITCRTQFFPSGGGSLIAGKGKVEVEGYECNLLYLAPFSNEQAEAYLRKIYSRTLVAKFMGWMQGDASRIERAKKLVVSMKSLSMRPLLLSYIEDLMDPELEGAGEYAAYKVLVDRWLRREVRKRLDGDRPTKEMLWEACESLALELHETGKRSLPEAELGELLSNRASVLSTVEVSGRSLLNRTSGGAYRFAHYSIQEFLVAHWLIETRPRLPESFRFTDQIKAFVKSWIFEDAQERLMPLIGALGRSEWLENPDEILPLERDHERDGSILQLVPGGDFILGKDEEQHSVSLSPYWIGKYPVTNEQYGKFLAATKHRKPEFWTDKRFNHPRQPVVGVSWKDAKAYCLWAGLDLPSEAQWEVAARGPEARQYPWGEEAPTAEHADFGQSWIRGKSALVGSNPQGAGPYGTEDQAGGVWEWCDDVWNEHAYRDRAGQRDPVATAEDEGSEAADRVLRGGSWLSPASSLHAALRSGRRAGDRTQGIGFRVCLSGPEP